MSTIISMKTVGELSDFKFAIPNYQRGYRWATQQVKELLDDIWEFSEQDQSHIYCIQPLVVCERHEDISQLVTEVKGKDNWHDIRKFVEENSVEEKQTWEVIDGQQRLTTISIIMQLLAGKTPFSIYYDTLKGKDEKINKIFSLEKEDAKSDINFHFMLEARETVEKWLDGKTDEIKQTMIDTIRNRVKFIWYKTDEDKPISVFTRLNVGRISLTSSELIKALFLNRENFMGFNDEITRARQTEIAQVWDRIENQLQDYEFWLFLRNLNEKHQDIWSKPTRIDFLLDFLCKEQIFNKMNECNNKSFNLSYDDDIVGKDQYRTFRIYYECYKSQSQKGVFLDLWHFIKEIFDIWTEWYGHPELYHYVGYVLTVEAMTLDDLVTTWLDNSRGVFISYIKDQIKKHLKRKKCQNLERDYFENGKDNKRDCIPLLLLHNVETIVSQNKVLTNNEQYQLGVFYKFPFHLYKIEHWDVEHIDSATKNDLANDEAQKNWILSAYQCLTVKQKSTIIQLLNTFFKEENESNNGNLVTFDDIYEKLTKILKIKSSPSGNWKNKVQNYVLLDRSTNRTYKNAIFPDKRSHIIGKEKGVHKIAFWDEKKSIIDEYDESFKSAFVPVCTKNVFQKTYSTMLGNPTVWDQTDSEAYKNDIENTLKEFLK